MASENESDAQDGGGGGGGGGGGYMSDPGARKKKRKSDQGASKHARVHISESHDTLEKLMRPLPPKKAENSQKSYIVTLCSTYPRALTFEGSFQKRGTTKKEPFSFENRIPNPSTRALRMQVNIYMYVCVCVCV
jgi:hypothetical protein